MIWMINDKERLARFLVNLVVSISHGQTMKTKPMKEEVWTIVALVSTNVNISNCYKNCEGLS